jgi:two-component system response regulator FixJ
MRGPADRAWIADQPILRPPPVVLYMQAQPAVPPPNLVVVIDDDMAVRNSLKFSLEVEGYAVRAYAGAEDLINETELPRPGCLIMDQHLPGTNGLAALDELRRRGVLMPAILITSHPSAAVRARAAAGGVPIIEKPLLGNTLLDAVHAAFVRSGDGSGA